MIKNLTKAQRILFSLAAVCLVLGAVFGFCLVGYLMTALVFWGLAACFAFYGVLAPKKTAAARWWRRGMSALLAVGLVLFLAAEIPVLADCRSDADTSAPHLIVCGAGVNGSIPSLSLTDRLDQALVWLEANPGSDAILSGSQGPGEDLSEAQAMFDWLTARGVDPARLILEEQAGSSYENIANSLALISPAETNPRVAILSGEYHLHRLGCMARKLGCEPVLVAARTTKPSLFINYAVREAFAMWKLWIFGP